MLKRHHHVTTIVRAVRRETKRVVSYELADPDDWELPPFTAGAHIDVHLGHRLVRCYSLCGDPADSLRYRIAVQREEAGRGGSIALQDSLEPGAVVSVSLPRNHFPVAVQAARHVLIAGGIGITPFLSMLPVLDRSGAGYELHYCGRDPAQMAFLPQLQAMLPLNCLQVYHSPRSGGQRLDLERLVASLGSSHHVYCCGPGGMVVSLRAAAERAAIPESHVHIEQFGVAAALARPGDGTFSIELARSGGSIVVGAHETMLEALRRQDVDVDSSCEAGACSACKVAFLAGIPEHRDLILKGADRERFIMPCVSRCVGPSITLDL